MAGAFKGVLGFVRDHWKTIGLLISGPFAPIVLLATDAFGVRSALEGAFKGMLRMVKRFARLIAAALLAPINLAIDAINAIKLPALKVNTHIPHVGTVSTPAIDPIPNIPRISIGGGITVVHTHVHLDGKEVAKSVTKHQTRSGRRTAVQTTGRNAGLGLLGH
jgi:hypothetical protein